MAQLVLIQEGKHLYRLDPIGRTGDWRIQAAEISLPEGVKPAHFGPTREIIAADGKTIATQRYNPVQNVTNYRFV